MTKATVDGLVTALVSLSKDTSVLERASSAAVLPPSEEGYTLFRHTLTTLLRAGRGVTDMSVTVCSNLVSEEMMGGAPKRGEIRISFVNDTERFTITIRQQSVHARGGLPYGTQ